MQMTLKLGDMVVVIAERGVAGTKIDDSFEQIVSLTEVVTGEVESFKLLTEAQACRFAMEILEPDGYPEGGLYDTMVSNPKFKM